MTLLFACARILNENDSHYHLALRPTLSPPEGTPMESFVIALREGVEAALVIGIIVAYLRRTGRSSLIGRVYLGLGIAVIASVAAGFVLPGLFRTVINEEAYEGVLQLMAAALILTLVIWMARAGKTVSRQDRKSVV